MMAQDRQTIQRLRRRPESSEHSELKMTLTRQVKGEASGGVWVWPEQVSNGLEIDVDT